MRTIMRMISEVAQEHVSADNERCAEMREAFQELDNVIDRRGDIMTSRERFAEVLTTVDFPYYFARTINRAVEARYQYMKGNWRDYCLQLLMTDYTTAERYRMSEFDRPVLRRVKDEARPGYIYEGRTQYGIADYAKQIDFERRILINDDLGAFDEIATLMADSTSRFLDWFVSALYDNVLTQAAMTALGVNYAGTGRLTTANLGIAWNAFAQRLDGRNNPLNIRPTYLVIPPQLELTANQILQSERIAELATNGINPMRGRLQVKIDPYIAVAPAAPANIPWYLFASPSAIPTVRYTKWTGRPNDFYLFAKAPDKVPMSTGGALGTANWRDGSFLTGDIEMSVETTIGSRSDDLAGLVGVSDAQGLWYSSGTTP